MASTLRSLTSREVSELPRDGATKTFRFAGVIVGDPRTGAEVTIEGPVNLDLFRPLTFGGVNAGGVAWEREGFALLVIEEDGVATPRRRLNVVARRLIELLHADLETGSYMHTRYPIQGVGSPPKTRYSFPPPGPTLVPTS